jgi:Tol biopolymer transport system component
LREGRSNVHRIGKRRIRATYVIAIATGVVGTAPGSAWSNPPTIPAPVTTVVSAGLDALAGTGFSHYPSVSANGRFVAFVSYAADLVEGDTNGQPDVFVRDLREGTTVRASIATDGTEGDLGVGPPAISADGRYVVFPSESSTLVPGDENTCSFFPEPGTCPDVFVHDLRTGETEVVSVRRDGTQADGESLYVSISGDGRYVAFASLATNLTQADRNGLMDVFVKDRVTGRVRRVSDSPRRGGANGFSFAPAISADGSTVAFTSAASNLARSDRNGVDDVFVRDLGTWSIRRVSVRADGTESRGMSFGASISATGRYVAFGTEGDLKEHNGVSDGYVLDLRTGRLRRFTVGRDGAEPSAGLEAPPSISATGRYVAFESRASNLVPRDRNRATDAYVRDLRAGVTVLVSVTARGRSGNRASQFPWISGNGCWVAFGSYATDLAGLGGVGDEETAQEFARGTLCHTLGAT